MLGGVHVVHAPRGGGAPSLARGAHYAAHTSLAYAAEWLGSGVEGVEGGAGDGGVLVASSSFYERDVHVWRLRRGAQAEA